MIPDCAICEDEAGVDFFERRMIVCPTCGHKRCPKASWHENACTNSNEPGQPGSFYGPREHFPRPPQATGVEGAKDK